MAQKVILVLLLLGLLAITLYVSSKYQEAQRFAGYQSVVRLVQAGQLLPDTQGDIRLPSHWRWLTKNGHIYEIKDPIAGLVLLFPDKVDVIQVNEGNGKVEDHRQIAGDLYC